MTFYTIKGVDYATQKTIWDARQAFVHLEDAKQHIKQNPKYKGSTTKWQSNKDGTWVCMYTDKESKVNVEIWIREREIII